MKLPQAMVLVFQPELGRSVWQDVIHQKRTIKSLVKYLSDGIKRCNWVSYRLIDVRFEVMGICPKDEAEFLAIQK